MFFLAISRIFFHQNQTERLLLRIRTTAPMVRRVCSRRPMNGTGTAPERLMAPVPSESNRTAAAANQNDRADGSPGLLPSSDERHGNGSRTTDGSHQCKKRRRRFIRRRLQSITDVNCYLSPLNRFFIDCQALFFLFGTENKKSTLKKPLYA